MTILLTLLQLLLGTFFTVSAIFKLIRHPHMIKEFGKLHVPYHWALLSAAIEIIAGPALIAGIWFPALAGAAAIAQAFVMAGAAYINFTRRGPRFGFGVVGLFAICIWIAVVHWAAVTGLLQ